MFNTAESFEGTWKYESVSIDGADPVDEFDQVDRELFVTYIAEDEDGGKVHVELKDKFSGALDLEVDGTFSIDGSELTVEIQTFGGVSQFTITKTTLTQTYNVNSQDRIEVYIKQ